MRWLACIRQLADLPEQRDTWLNPENPNPHFTFVEYVCCYFDDLSLDEADGYATPLAQGLITPEEHAAVAALHAMLSAYEPPDRDDDDHEAILADPAWWAVAEEARRAIGCLHAVLCDPEERRALSQPSTEALRARRLRGRA